MSSLRDILQKNLKLWLALLVIILVVFLAWRTAFKSENGHTVEVKLPGSQPHSIRTFEPPSKCRICHSPPYQTAPYPLWRGSMMSQAARDPLFYAALAVANQDSNGSGDLCLRCHTPQGWLLGRSEPADGSALMDEDLDGVTCDFCHRLIDPASKEGAKLTGKEPVTAYGNGMYVVGSVEPKRGPRPDSYPTHKAKYTAFFKEGDLCGTCHDVTNPFNNVPIERTYSEWRYSWYAKQGTSGSCQACHMRPAGGFAAEPKLLKAKVPYREDVAVHDLTGGSNWIYDALPLLWDNLDVTALRQGKQRALNTLRRAAKIEIKPAANKKDAVVVKVTNLTGHKLPTGYPEGRRMWLNVKGFDGAGRLIFESGRYNAKQAKLIKDRQLKVYRAKPGIKGKGPTFHFILNDYFALDNRIPPRGFTNKAFKKAGAGVIGYHYQDGQYWDETTYQLPAGVRRVKVDLMYQTAEKSYIDFLRQNNKTDEWGKKITAAWEKTGRGAPVSIATAEKR